MKKEIYYLLHIKILLDKEEQHGELLLHMKLKKNKKFKILLYIYIDSKILRSFIIL